MQRFGHYAVTREEVLDFAHRYDPSPHHIDDSAAADNPMFGRVSASGAHSIAMLTRMMVGHWQATGQQGMGSAGFQVRFLQPVYPGDVLSCELAITNCTPCRSHQRFGKIHYIITMRRQNAEPVMELIGSSFHERRAANASPLGKGSLRDNLNH